MKTSQVYTFIATGLLVVSALGCSAKISGGGAPLAPPVVLGAPAGTPTVLEGKWSSGCMAYGQSYLNNASQFTNGSVTMVTTVFTDSACATTAIYTDTETGTFSVGASSATVVGATNLDASLTNAQGQTSASYQIFKIDGDNLYMGDHSGQTELDRPTVLDQTHVLKRVK